MRSLGRDVAQPGSASHWGCGGRRFESSRPDQFSGARVYPGTNDRKMPRRKRANDGINIKTPYITGLVGPKVCGKQADLTRTKPRRPKAIARAPGFCGFVRARPLLCLAANQTPNNYFIFCDLCPEAADFKPLWTASLASSVTFQFAPRTRPATMCGQQAVPRSYPDCQRACPVLAAGAGRQ